VNGRALYYTMLLGRRVSVRGESDDGDDCRDDSDYEYSRNDD
jgi:hypothetical protein